MNARRPGEDSSPGSGPRELDVDDVTRCPLALLCGTSGCSDGGLEVAAVETAVGVCCVTLCSGCVAARALPRFDSWAAAIGAVGEHCTHLGCDVDEMAAALETTRSRPHP